MTSSLLDGEHANGLQRQYASKASRAIGWHVMMREFSAPELVLIRDRKGIFWTDSAPQGNIAAVDRAEDR